LYQDKICSNSENSNNTKGILSADQAVFNDCFQINDPDYEAGRADPLE
jgi:hypothetical protein